MVWPPGQPADVKSGRLVFNTNIHGTVFNTAAGKQTLAAFLDGLRRSTAAVFPPRTFGAMVLNGGSGLRLVNDASFPCSCESECVGQGPGCCGARMHFARCWVLSQVAGWLPRSARGHGGAGGFSDSLKFRTSSSGPCASRDPLPFHHTCSCTSPGAGLRPGLWAVLSHCGSRRCGQCDLGQVAVHCHPHLWRGTCPGG